MAPLPLPKIATDLALRPDDRATSSSVMAGRRIAGQFNEAAEALGVTGHAIGSGIAAAGKVYADYEHHREVSQGAVAFSQMQQSLVTQWNEIASKADPNNPATAKQFSEQVVEPALEKFKQAFRTEGGQTWADHHTATLRDHMFAKTTADMSTLAGHAAVVNTEQLVNTLSNTAMADPTATKTSMDMFKSTVADLALSNPNLTPAQRAHFTSEITQKGLEKIAQSAVFGAIQRNPDQGLKFAQDPELSPYLSGFDVKRFEQYARSQQSLARSEANNQRMAEKHAEQEASDATMRDILPRIYSDKPDVTRAELNGLLERKQMTLPHYEFVQKLLDRSQAEKLPPGVEEKNVVDMMMQIRSGQITSVNDIYGQMSEGKYGFTKAQQLIRAFQDMKDESGGLGKTRAEFFRTWGNIVNPSDAMGGKTPQGYERQYILERNGRDWEAALRRKSQNPDDAYNPTSPDFIGKQPWAQAPSPASTRAEAEDVLRARNAPKPDMPGWIKSSEWAKEARFDPESKRWYVLRDGRRKWIKEE